MENATVKGRVISVIKCMCSGIEVSPDAMPMAGGALHAMNVAISGQPISISGQVINANISGAISGVVVKTSGQVANISGAMSGIVVNTSGQVANISGAMSGIPINITSGSIQISGVALISGTVSLGTKIAGEDIENDVMIVRIASGYRNTFTISGQVANISGAMSGAPVRTSGQASVISGQIVRARISGQVVNISGAISGAIVKISGQQIYFQSGTENIRSSGQSITINQSQLKSGLQCVSGRQMLTDIITDMKASYPPSLWRIMIAVGNAGQLNAKVKNADCVSGYSAVSLNEGTDLTSGALYMFDVINQSGDELNLTYDTSAPIQVLRIHEITAGTQ